MLIMIYQYCIVPQESSSSSGLSGGAGVHWSSVVVLGVAG